jgi:PhzF family phenazine biosynthesis protein
VGVRITQVDSFTDRPFQGNPAAVCILAAAADEDWMRKVAREMNLSETAFLVPQTDGFQLRWFTPSVEVDLCGHATLAAAHVLWEEGHLQPQQTARFHTRSGLLTAARNGNWIELNFPAIHDEPAAAPEGLGEALGAQPRYVGRNRFDYLVELESAEAVRALRPDFAALKKVQARAISVTSRSDSAEYDFVSRVFGPGSGIDEDPVTGSAHCYLGPYWQRYLGKSEFVAYQASARGGVVRVRLSSGVNGDRVILGGQAVTVMRAEFL